MKMKTTGLRQALLTALCGAGVGLAATSTAAGFYELDGDALNNPGDNFFEADQIYCDHNPSDSYCESLQKLGIPESQTEYSGALISGFIFDPYNSGEDDIFQTSVKDSTDPATKWSWTVGSANDKNDISHTWVAVSQDNVSGDYFLHFGISVISENGNAAFGIWFNQNNIIPTTVDGKRVFLEGHKTGDILVQADVVSGGTVSRFDVYTWGTIPDPNNNLLNDPVASSQGELTAQIRSTDCSKNPDPRACAVTNASATHSPWEYQAKNWPNSNEFPPIAYFEGKLNLTSLFPGELPCVGSVVAETRQSQSETASLEDFAASAFDLCSIEVRKTGPALSKVGDDPEYTIEIENTGVVVMSKESITDSLQADLSSVDPDCGATLQPGAVCTISYSREVQAGDPDPLNNTVTAVYSGQGDTDTETASHSINLFQPSVTLDKKANGSDGTIKILQGAEVNYAITVKNTSSSDTPTLDCKITDTKLAIGNESDGDGNAYTVDIKMDPGDQVVLNKGKADSTDDLDVPNMQGYTNTASVLCTLADFPNQVSDSDSVTVKVRPRDVSIAVSKTGDNYGKAGDDLNYTITIKNVSDANDGSPVYLDSINDSLKGDLTAQGDCPDPSLDETLAIGGSCTISYSLTTAAGDTGKNNTVTVKATDSFGNADTGSASHQAVLINPKLDVTESCTTPEVEVGDSVTFRTYVENNGDIALTVDLENSITGTSQVLLAAHNGDCLDSDFGNAPNDAADGCLLIETTTTATSAGTISSSTSAVGSMPEYTGLPNTVMDSGSDNCTINEPPGGATRTLGFWKTHGSDGDRTPGDYGYTCHVFENHLGGMMELGWKTAQTCADVFNLFWANPSKEDDGSRRDRTCQQTRYIQASWQLMAAILNTGLDNGATPPTVGGESAIELMQQALANGDRKAVTQLLGVLAEYNESGDDEPIVDNDGTAISPADPNGTREEGAENAFGFNSCP